MSDVFSFRLESKNPREAQAREVIDTWARQGYSLRHILTEALLLLGNQQTNSNKMSEITETVDKLSRLVERLEGRLEVVQAGQPVEAELSESFLSAIKLAAKPGIRKINE